MQTRLHVRVSLSNIEDAWDIINDRRAAREEGGDYPAWDHLARSRSDLRHTINRSYGRSLSQSSARREEEAFFIDLTYHCDTGHVGVEACIENLARRINRMVEN